MHEESKSRTAAGGGGDVTVDVREGQLFLDAPKMDGAGGSTLNLSPAVAHHHHRHHDVMAAPNADPLDSKLCLESVGLLFAGSDVSYV